MSISGKKFSWKNVSDFLTDKELKNVMGGSEGMTQIYVCQYGQQAWKYVCDCDPCETYGHYCCYSVTGKHVCGHC